MSFSRSTVTRIAFPSPSTITPGPGSYDIRLPRAFVTDENHHAPTHPVTVHPHATASQLHSPPPSNRTRRMSTPCSGAELPLHGAAASSALPPSSTECATPPREPSLSKALVSTPIAAASPCSSSSPSHSPLAPPELTSSAQKRRLARQAQRGITLQPLPHIVTSPEVLRDKAREQPISHTQQQQQPQPVSPTATTASMDESAGEQRTKTAVTATPLHAPTNPAAPSSCRRFRFADVNEGGVFSSPAQQPHPITALSHTVSPAKVSANTVDVRIQRLEERCRELEEARRRSHAAWMEELSSQALSKQQLTAQRQRIEELETQTATLTQQRDTHATRVQQLQADMSASMQKQLDEGGRLLLLHEQHMFLDEVSAQQSAAITALKADVVAKEQHLAALQSCLDAEKRRYEELRSGVDGSIATAQQIHAALSATQAELQAVSRDKEQLVFHMDELERQVDEATAREQRRATQERETNSRTEADRRQLIAKWEESESERQQLVQQTAQLQADVVHWQHKLQNESDSHTAAVLQHKHALAVRHGANAGTPQLSSPTSAASTSHPSEQKEERVSRLAAVRRQLTDMRDNISQRLAALRPVKRKDEKLLALQAELERSEAEMERLLKEHESTWQQVNRARRERCHSCGGFHHGSNATNQRDTTQHSSASGEALLPVEVQDALLKEMSAFNRRLQADNTALRERVETLMKERDEAVTRARQRRSGVGSADSKVSGSGKKIKRDKRARECEKENESVLQPMDVNGLSGDRKHRRSMTASGSNNRQSMGAPARAQK